MTDETKCLECHGTRKVRDQFGNWDWIPCPTCALAPDFAAATPGPARKYCHHAQGNRGDCQVCRPMAEGGGEKNGL